MRLIQYGVDALGLGATYALAALSIALLFGLMRLINFAHGELIVFGGYIMWYLSSERDYPWIVVFPALFIGVAILALAMERVAFRPLRRASPPILLVTSFAVSFILQNIFFMLFGASTKSVGAPAMVTGPIELGELRLSRLSVITVVVTGLIIFLLWIYLKKTRIGLQMLGAAEDFEMARMLGVPANRVISIAFLLSGLMAAVVSFLLIARRGEVHPSIGLPPVLISFVAIVVGGMGSMVGAAVGGMILGITITILQVSLSSELLPFRDAFTFMFVISILLFRPQGLMGREHLESRA